MNPDRKFADFLLTMTPSEFDKWAETKSLVEVEAATETIRRAIISLAEEAAELIEQDLNDMSYDAYGYEDAREVLSKFTINGL
jgi:hypothetical protein